MGRMKDLSPGDFKKYIVMRAQMNKAAIAVLKDMAKRTDKAKHSHAMFCLSERLITGIVVTIEQMTTMDIEETLVFLMEGVREQLEELHAAEIAQKRGIH